MFTPKDIDQMANRGISPALARKQIEHFITGFPFVRLNRPATAGDGIIAFSKEQTEFYSRTFMEAIPVTRILKFVPASGAASRMFKHLFEFASVYNTDNKGIELFESDKSFNSVHYFIHHIHQLALYDLLNEKCEKAGSSLDALIENQDYKTIIDTLLGADGLQYASLPKALLLFHRYRDGSRTAAEEHLIEATEYAVDNDKIARIHFTISPEHESRFRELFSRVLPRYEQNTGVQFDITWSIQKPSTDTIAADENNAPFRNPDGTLHFRPGGHGALIDNLNDLDADLIFVKNIDNIIPDRLKPETYLYKKVIGGYLISIKQRIDHYLQMLENQLPSPILLQEVTSFVSKELAQSVPTGFDSLEPDQKTVFLFNAMNRPVRVCGMVKNEGEPGGGPFWVDETDGRVSLQIVESSQIDMKNQEQTQIVRHATHFNPVDLVCAIRDHRGKKYDLKQFVDENTGFISVKSAGGKTLKAQELPGLWNGAMARWITLFAEVPIITFNPVKTINDLLRDEHINQ